VTVFYHSRRRTFQSDGRITEVLAGSFFRVELDSGFTITARPNAKMTMHCINLFAGDRVLCEMPTDSDEVSKGRIVFRYADRQ
jgi:translation initiation factor IF-1